MWRVFAALLTLIVLSPHGRAAQPRAVISGPTSGPVGVKVFFDCKGTAWDKAPDTPHWIWLADQPVGVTSIVQYGARAPGPAPSTLLELLLAEDGSPAYIALSPGLPGRYVLAVGCTGRLPDTTGPDGKPVPGRIVPAGASWVFEAGVPRPTPTPGPDPPPNPVPTPTPVPVPVPVVPVPVVPVPMSTKLYAIAVFPPDAAGADNFAFAAVRDDPTLPATLGALNVRWLAWPNTDPRVDSLKLRPYLGDPAAGPQVVIYDGAGNVYDGTGAKIDKARPTPVRAPLTVQDAVNLFKKIRGQ